MNFLKIFKRRNATEKGLTAGGYQLPITGGTIGADWPWNFWQQGRNVQGGNAQNATVFSCAALKAQTVATLNAVHRRKQSNGGYKEIQSSPLARVLHQPNSYQTRSDFFMNLVFSLMYRGNAYAVASRDDRNQIKELHLISGDTQPYIENETQTVFYALGDNPLAGDISALAPARDVLHIKLHTINNPLVGVSPLHYLANTLSANNAITDHQATFFNNMSRPSGVISTDQQLNRDQMAQLREAWKQQSERLNSGGIPILHSGMKFNQLSLSSQDAQIIDAFNMSKDQIAMAFRVPLPLIGDTRNANYSNVEQLISLWLATGLGFLLEHIECAFAKFFGLPVGEGMNFKTDALLRTDFAGRIDALTKGITGGLYSVNEARAHENLPAVRYGDEPRLQAQVVPLSQVDKIETAPPVPVAPVAPPPIDEDTKQDAEREKIIALHYFRKALINE